MNFVSPTTPPAISRWDDRAQGSAGLALRQSVEIALEPRDLRGRGQNIYDRLSAALHRASVEEGTHTSPEAVGRALDLLASIPTSFPLPQVVVESDSEVGLDWDEGSRRVLSLTVRENPMVGYSALFGAEPLYGRVPFFGELPETLRFLLARLYPQRSNR